MKRLGRAAMTTAVVCVCSNGARAEEEVPADLQAERNWAVAVHLGWMGAIAGAGQGALGGWAPMIGATLERRLDERLWAMVRADGSYSGARMGELPVRSLALAGSVGLRHALTPPEPVEVSWYAALDGTYARTSPPEMAGWSAGLRLGVALDKHFNDWLGLRVGLDVARAGYQRAESYDVNGLAVPVESWFASVNLAPSFALRFAF